MRSWTFELGLSSLALKEMFLTNRNARKYFIFIHIPPLLNNNKNISRSKGEFKNNSL